MAVEPARASLIDGKAFSQTLVERVAAAAARLESAHGVKPGLAVVIVGEDPASQLYVRNKGETTLKAGMRSDTHRLPAETTQAELLALIASLNADAGIHGILVQLPLPKHIDSAPVLDAISPDKDVDGFHVVNAGRLAVGLPGLVPCTPLGCLLMLKDQLGDLSGLHAVVVGRSNIVGKPMAQLLLGESCTVTIAHSRTRDLPAVCRAADILVAAVGVLLVLEATRRCAAFLALPTHADLGLKLAWESADHLWRWAGDTSTDWNHYSKRTILSGILIPALTLRWFEGRESAERFVAHRIENVMAFEKWKAGKDFDAPFRKATDVLARMRYGSRTAA